MADSRDYSRWKERVRVSHRKFDAQMKDRMELWRNYYRGRQWKDTEGGAAYNEKIVVNMVFSNMRILLPSINFRNPKIFVSAKKQPYNQGGNIVDTLSQSFVLEMLLNYYYRELKIKKQADKCLLDAALGPWGIMQIGYSAKTEIIEGGDRLEVNELLREDSPFVIRRSPKDLRVDPEAQESDLSDAGWIALRWIKSVEDVKRYPKYKNVSKIKANYTVDTDYSGHKVSSSKEEEYRNEWERVEGWDIWDRKSDRLMTYVEGHDTFLQDISGWPIAYEGFPVETLYFNENPDEIWPISDVEIYKTQQDELNRIRSLHLEHVKKISMRKYLTQENMMEDSEIWKITHGASGTVATTKGDPNTTLIPLKEATVSQDIYMTGRMLKDDIRESQGVASYESGVSEKYDTATEPALIAQSINMPREDRKSIFEDFVVRVTKKLAQVIQQTHSEKSIPMNMAQFSEARKFAESKIHKIAGPDGAMILNPWLMAAKEDIQGEYDFDIEVGSTQPMNQEIRKRDAMTIYSALQGNPNIDSYEGTKQFLDAFNRQDLEKLLKDKEVVAQEMQQNQQMAIAAQQAVDEPKRQVDMAKTQMKSQTTLQVAEMKGKVSLLSEALKARKEKSGK